MSRKVWTIKDLKDDANTHWHNGNGTCTIPQLPTRRLTPSDMVSREEYDKVVSECEVWREQFMRAKRVNITSIEEHDRITDEKRNLEQECSNLQRRIGELEGEKNRFKMAYSKLRLRISSMESSKSRLCGCC